MIVSTIMISLIHDWNILYLLESRYLPFPPVGLYLLESRYLHEISYLLYLLYLLLSSVIFCYLLYLLLSHEISYLLYLLYLLSVLSVGSLIS
jgi:hypothetical protein